MVNISILIPVHVTGFCLLTLRQVYIDNNVLLFAINFINEPKKEQRGMNLEVLSYNHLKMMFDNVCYLYIIVLFRNLKLN